MSKFAASFLFFCIALANHAVPKRRLLVLHAFPDVEDQMVAVLRWLRDNPDRRMPVIFLVSGSAEEARNKLLRLVGEYVNSINILRKNQFSAIWSYCRASHVFFTHGLYGFRAIPDRQCVVNLWHGMPLKRIWSGMKGCPPPPCTWLLSTSEKYSKVQAAAAEFSVSKVPVTGLPRNDLLFSSGPKLSAFEAEARNGVERVVLFLPTYRKSAVGYATVDGAESASATGLTAEETQRLKDLLASLKIRMLVKPHPMSVHYGAVSFESEYLWSVSDAWFHEKGVTLYEVLGRADSLITDVSSVAIDYLCLRRPIIFYFPDMAKYGNSRKFQLEPIEDWLPGPLCGDFAQLCTRITAFARDSDEFGLKRGRIRDELNPQNGPGAVARLFELSGA